MNLPRARALLHPILLILLLSTPAAAQVRLPKLFGGTSAQSDSQSRADSVASCAQTVEPGSPRQSMERYFELSREGRWADAAHYLSTGTADTVDAAKLAEELKVVLDRHLWIDLDQLSPLAEGDTTDGLKGAMDQVGTIPRPNGLSDPVRIVKVTRGDDSWWAFAPSVVRQVDNWYCGTW